MLIIFFLMLRRPLIVSETSKDIGHQDREDVGSLDC